MFIKCINGYQEIWKVGDLLTERGNARGEDLAVGSEEKMDMIWVCELEAPALHSNRHFQERLPHWNVRWRD